MATSLEFIIFCPMKSKQKPFMPLPDYASEVECSIHSSLPSCSPLRSLYRRPLKIFFSYYIICIVPVTRYITHPLSVFFKQVHDDKTLETISTPVLIIMSHSSIMELVGSKFSTSLHLYPDLFFYLGLDVSRCLGKNIKILLLYSITQFLS